jgi:hypothetical protein
MGYGIFKNLDRFLFQLIIISVGISFFFKSDASPLPIHFTGIKNIDNSLEKCHKTTLIPLFRFSESDFFQKNRANTSNKIKKAAVLSANSRFNFIRCVNELLLSIEEENSIRYSLNIYYDSFWSDMEMYNRWFYYLDNKVPIKRYEFELFASFYQTKAGLYKLLERRTIDLLRQEKDLSKNYDPVKELTSIYLSIYKLHFEFYESVSESLRKELLKK